MASQNTVSHSSIESQRALRIEKLNNLAGLGFEPYPVVSQRDYTLRFVKFWFDWIVNTDFQEVTEEIAPVTMDYFLHQVLFPKNLLEQAEEMLQIRSALKSMGLDPDDERFKGKGIPEKVIEYRKFFPMLSALLPNETFSLLTKYVKVFTSTNGGHKSLVPTIFKGQTLTLAGRIKSKRGSGKIAFLSVEDESLPSGFQFILRSDVLVDRVVHELNENNLTKEVKAMFAEGKKSIHTQAKSSKVLANAQNNDLIELPGGQQLRIKNKVEFATLIEGYASNLDFRSVLPNLPKKTTVENIRNAYKKVIGEEGLLELEKGIIAYYLEPWNKGLNFEQCKELLDEGDYVQASGKLEYSKSGEPSLLVERVSILAKALRPLPEGIESDNLEFRYLHRVADFKLNTMDTRGYTIRDLMYKKSRYWQIWRDELLALNFLEVECPVFEHTPGGAEARPFTTFYEALDQEVFLRISLELPLKKLIAGGFEKVFEIGRIFRNEGVSPQHLQEYTQMEFYWSYADYIDCMNFVQRVYRKQVQELTGSLNTIDYNGAAINWGEWVDKAEVEKNGWDTIAGWPMIKYFDAVKHYSYGKADMEGKNLDELKLLAGELGVKFEGNDSKARVMDLIWKKTARPHIINPIFLVLPPVELEPLAKRDPENNALTQRFQVVAGGAELGKGFSELNDPMDQRARFEEQQAARDAGDEEAQFMDEEYLEAMEYGMPPLTGFGISERFFSFIMGKPIKELVTFPAVAKQESETKNRTESDEEE